MKIFKRVIRYINAYKKEREVLSNHKQFLRPGRYVYVDNGKSIYFHANCQEAEKFIEDSKIISKEVILKGATLRFKVITYLKRSIKKYLFTVRISPKETSEFNGSLGLITGGEEIKIFDFEEKKVFSHISNQEKYRLIKEAHAQFHRYFRTPILQFDDESQGYIERYVEFLPPQQWKSKERRKIAHHIFARYTRYFKYCNKKQLEMVKVEDVVKGWEKNPIMKGLIDKKAISLDEILHLEFPAVPLHGDLYSSNILLEGNEIYFIDFEYYGNYLFFYDLMCWILIEFIFRKNETCLLDCMAGKYDFKFEAIFQLFGLKYDANMKKEYFMIVVLEQLMKRDDCSMEEYLQFFNRLEEIQRNMRKEHIV